MRSIPRVRTALAVAGVLLGSALVGPAVADAPVVPALPQDYVDRVNDVLRDDTDRWGEQLLRRPNGPTLEATKALLVPANVSDGLTDSGYHYLPFTYPRPTPDSWHTKRAFSLHVADGSAILSDWDRFSASQTATFSVGADATDTYGSAQDRLDEPALADGFLPVLRTTYTDATGARFERESFTSRVGGDEGPLVSYVKVTVRPGAVRTMLRLNLRRTDGVGGITASGTALIRDGRTYVQFSAGARWTTPNLDYEIDPAQGAHEMYLLIANTPASLGRITVDATAYNTARRQVGDYWRGVLAGGAEISVPEAYAADALRNLLIQNLVSGWQLSIGNGYESTDPNFAYPPEASAAITSFGQFGYRKDFRDNLQALLHRRQGGELGGNWIRAVNLQNAARYFFLTNDRGYVEANLMTFMSYLDIMRRQAANDPNGLLEKEKYGADLHETVYGLHHQAEAWRGLRDLGLALRQMGRTEADRFVQFAEQLRGAVLTAVSASQTRLADGSLYVPIALLEPSARTPFHSIAATRDGSYYNLTIPFALATGILPEDSARGVRDYVTKHGGMFLGLTRFNLPGVDPGVCEVGGVAPFGNAPGYRSHGVDEQYGYSWARHLADARQSDQLALLLYSKLGQDLTPGTFVGGEGTSVAPCPELGEYHRTQFRPPMAGNNAVYLQTVRSMLVAEGLDGAGVPKRLTFTPSTPRDWLGDGRTVAMKNMPTQFGPVSYSVTSQLSQRKITASVTAPAAEPGRFRPSEMVLGLRVPAGYRLRAATVNGSPRPFDADAGTVDLGTFSGTVDVTAEYDTVAVSDPDQAAPVALSVGRGLVKPGGTVQVSGQVEALGSATVRGRVTTGAPPDWRVDGAQTTFSLSSNGKFAWHKFGATVTVPAGTAPGEYDVTVTTTPDSGQVRQRKLRVRVAVPAEGSYESLVKSQPPTAYWRLNDHRSKAVDSSQYGTHGDFRGNVTRLEAGAIADDPNRAVLLNDGYVEVPHALPVTPSAPYSQEAWIKITNARQQGVIEKYDAPGNNGFVLRLVTGNKLQAAALAGPGTTAPTVTGRTTVLPGEWHHVVATYDGGKLSVYVDGRLEARLATSQNPRLGSGTLKIGARGDDGHYRLGGWIDEVALYDYALTPAQIDAHFVKGVLGSR
jgi:hypothetical protein